MDGKQVHEKMLDTINHMKAKQTKTTMITLYTVECSGFKRPNVSKDIEELKVSSNAGWNGKWHKHFGEQFGRFFFFLKT